MAGMPCSTASPVRRRIATVHCLGGRLPNGNGLTPRFRGFDCFCWQQTSHGAPFLSSPPAVQAKNALAMVEKTNEANDSLCRVDFDPRCEAAINEQINVEYNVSYVYHAMYTYFARDNVGLTNIAEFFKKESAEERHHAELLMEYQIKRGGAVKLETILPPHTEFDHAEKGDALYAFELALSLEKLNFQKLRQLHEVAEKHGDSQMCDFIEGSLLADQMESVYEVAEKVAQLRRVGKGLGVYVFDQELGGAAA